MSQISLESLINAVCHGASASVRQRIIETGNLMVDGVPFTIVPGGSATGDESSLYIYCDFGALPPEQAIDVIKRLLEINLFLYGRDTPSFVFNPTTEHVLFACRLDRDDLTPQRFVRVLREFALYAQQWQLTGFLTEEDGDPPSRFGSVGFGKGDRGNLPSMGVRK